MAFGGAALKGVSLFARIIQFGCAAVILGIFSYFLASLANSGLSINNHLRAVEGISGAAVLYTIIGFLFVCCLGGITFFGLFSILLDFAFAGAFAYAAWVNRNGADSCTGTVTTIYGTGSADNNNRVQGDDGKFIRLPRFRTACRLQTAAFAVAIIGCLFFLLSIPISLGMIKHHRKEKAFGPSPKNNYTAGSPRRRHFWQRRNRGADPEYGMAGGKAHPDSLPSHATPTDMRTSYATDTTAVGGETRAYDKYSSTPYGGAGGVQEGYAAPHGTAVPGNRASNF